MNTNILVTSYTTQESPSQMWGGDPLSLDVTAYEEILSKLVASGEKHFNLIGGEPTAHYDLKPILERTNNWCRKYGMTATLVTNCTYLENYISSIGEFISLIVQIAPLETFTAINQYTSIRDVLLHIDNLGWFDNGKAICQFELAEKMFSLDYIENLLLDFTLPLIRVNFPPISLNSSPEEFYGNLKTKFLEVCEVAYKHHISIDVDSYNAVPLCYFTEGDKARISLVCSRYPKFSKAFRLVILPTLECIYDRYNNLEQIIKANLKDFETTQDLNKYLLLAVYYPLTGSKSEGRCGVCPHANLFKCDGRYLFNPTAKIKEDEEDE